MAGLYYHYGVPKHELKEKKFGVFRHKVLRNNSQLLKGFDDNFLVPHSRHTEIRREDVVKNPNLRILSESDECGIYAISDLHGRQIFITGHSEYDVDTLKKEYERDIAKGLDIDIPKNYFEDDDPKKNPIMRWRSSATLLYTNWLNYYVYQQTPFDLSLLQEIKHTVSPDGEIIHGTNS